MSLSPSPLRRRHRLRAALLGAVATIAVGAVVVESGVFTPSFAVADTQPQASAGPASFADVVDRVKSAVVSVKVKMDEGVNAQSDFQGMPHFPPGSPFERFFRDFGGPNEGDQGDTPMPRHQQHHMTMAQGSGFFISSDGYIVTNNHVVDHATEVTVTTSEGKTLAAKVIGADPKTDLALLKVKDPGTYPFVKFAGKAPRVGDWVIAVGNPFGLGGTVTAGIVSARGRDIGSGPYDDFIQIDAPINRGNSGGPTFDLHGQVIGMNSMIFSPSGGSVGIGFAIPASLIHDVVAQLKEHGRVTRGWLGVEIQPVTPEIASALGLKENKGAIVASVVTGGPAAKAGFEQGDVVTAIDGQAVDDSKDVVRRVAGLVAGRTSTFTVNRQGKVEQIKVTIGQKPEDKVAANMLNSGAMMGPASASAMGLGLSPLTPEARRTFNLADDVAGVVITKVDPDSDAADKGLQPGDVVLKIGSRAVRTPADVQTGIVEAQKGGRKSVLLLVARQSGGTGFVAVDIGQT